MGIGNTITWPEVAWTAIALIGLGFSWMGYMDARVDLHYLEALGRNGARRIIAKANIRAELTRLLAQAGFAAIGVITMTLPNETGDRLGIRAGVLALILIAVEVRLVFDSVADRSVRKTLLNKLTGND